MNTTIENPSEQAAQPEQQAGQSGQSGGFAGLLPTPEALRHVAWYNGVQLVNGSTFWPFWNMNPVSANVTIETPPYCEFSSEWQEKSQPTLDDLSYALYRFRVAPDSEPTLSTGWIDPPSPGGCYIGVANYATNHWDWFPCTGEEISLQSLDNYLSTIGSIDTEFYVTLVVCVLEQGPLQLGWIRIGPDLPPQANLGIMLQYIPVTEPASIWLSGSDAEFNITLYELDLDGDGVFEYSSPDPIHLEHTYSTPGDYNVAGKVTDAAGLTATDELTLHVSAFTDEAVDGYAGSPSLAIGAGGIPEISYGQGPDYDLLRLARKDSGHWSATDLETVTSQDNLETAMLIEPGTGAEVIAYGNTELHVGRNEGDTWTSEVVDDLNGEGRPAIVLDGDGYVNVFHAHRAGAPPDLLPRFYRTYDTPSGWEQEELYNYQPAGQFCDADYQGGLAATFATNEGGYPGFLYYGVYDEISGWTWDPVADDLNLDYGEMSLAVNPLDQQPQLVYISDPGRDGNEHIATYVRYDGDVWQFEQLEEYSSRCDLTIDSQGYPHIVAPEGYTIYHHWYDGTQWHRDYVSSMTADALEDLELALDENDKAHVCWTYFDSFSGGTVLRYATEVY